MKTVHEFFASYAKAASGSDPHAIANFYGDDFMAAGPKGAMTFKNDDKFIEWLTGVISFNRQTGMGQMKVKDVYVERIGNFFFNARIRWATTFKKLADEVITFDINYIVRLMAEEYKIIMYISHEDQEELMRNKNLLD